jgi:uncharacterized phage protein (TIGR01671 family)
MREIKFRAWDGKKMLESQDLTQSSKYWSWLGKEDIELMQYTGLKDKNGVPIFEGDIIETKINGADTYQTVIKNEMSNNCGCCIWTWGWYVPGEEEDIKERCTVIGNVFENPELLDQA